MTARTTKSRWLRIILALLPPAFGWFGCAMPPPSTPLTASSYRLCIDPSLGPENETRVLTQRIYQHLEKLLGCPEATGKSLRIILADPMDETEARFFPALYRTSTQSIRFHRKPDCMLLLHEITHYFIQARLGEVPVWLNEGLATYLGWSAMDEVQLLVGEIPVVHFKTLRRMAIEGRLTPFDRFLSLSPGDFYQAKDSYRNYSQAWGMVFFLFHGVFPAKLTFKDKVDRLAAMTPKELISLEASFQRFCRDYSITQTLQERLTFGPILRRLSSAYRLGLHQDPKGMSALLVLAGNPEADLLLRRVALASAAMIALGSGDGRLGMTLNRAIQQARADDSAELQQLGNSLEEAFRQGRREAVVAIHGLLSMGYTFYPAQRLMTPGKELNGP